MRINVKNLEKLARGLMTVPESLFEMGSFQKVFDGKLFAEKHPVLARREIDKAAGETADDLYGECLEALNPYFTIQHDCGTAGCALGWAPTLVKRGRKDEDWADYCERVFGVDVVTDLWDFMFGGSWSGEQNTPTATAGRIMYVVNNGEAPALWSFKDPVMYPEFSNET